MMTQQKNLQLIQMLRGVASILVVLYHITVNCFEITGQTFLFGIFNFGGSGVDIFFVLSGFIIAYANVNILAKPAATGTFLKRRFVRIFPIYWIIITCFLLLQLLLPSFYNTTFDTGFNNIVQTYLLLPGHVMLNGVSWSLTNELFFYLLFTLAILIPGKKISFWLMVSYFTLLIVLALTNQPAMNRNAYTEILVFPMNIEFFLGVFIVLLVNHIPKNQSYPILIAGILLFVGGAFLNNNDVAVVSSSSNPALNRVLLFGIPSFLVILGLVKMELSRTVKMHNLFLKLGDASYSIYLIHLPIVVAFFKLLVKFNITNSVVLYLLTFFLLIMVCAGGIYIYQYVEKPLIKTLNKLLL